MQIKQGFAEWLANQGEACALEERTLVAGGDPDLPSETRRLAVPAHWSPAAAETLLRLLDTPRPVRTQPKPGVKAFGGLTPHVADGETRQLESSLDAVTTRLAGSLAWSAARQGAFDEASDAEALARELAASIQGGFVTPDAHLIREGGVDWGLWRHAGIR